MASSPHEEKRLLFVSNLFPCRPEPVRGLDNANLLHALSPDWEIRVISPRPVFPPWKKAPGDSREDDERFDPVYVPSPYVPKTGDRWNERLMARALEPAFAVAVENFRPHVVLASWLFPDGCAVAKLADLHELPVVLITQGTDTHHYLDLPIRRKKILAAIDRAEAVICRSGDLARRLESAGADPGKLKVIYNGIDPAVFGPGDRGDARRKLDLEPDGPILLFVGNLLPVKDPLFLVEALVELNRRRSNKKQGRARLVMIGEGPLRSTIESEALRLGVSDGVELPGRLPPDQIAKWMSAADVLCLSSRNEGFPNVILEAMACALPVVSTDVGGIAELVDDSAIGRLVPPGDLNAYADALEIALEPQREAKFMAPPFDPDWARAAREYAGILESACSLEPGVREAK